MKDIIKQIRALPRWQQFAIVQGILAELMIDERNDHSGNKIPAEIMESVNQQREAWLKGELETISKDDFHKKMKKLLLND